MKPDSRSFNRLDTSLSRLFFLVLLLWGLYLCPAASAQTVDYQATRTALQTRVHLKLGETTLAKTLQELSKQTGLQIQPADYLQDRDLLVELNNMSARDVLYTLAESNNWIWYEAKQGQIFVAHPKFDRTQELLNVAPAFRVIVPKDLRRFVGLDVSNEDLGNTFRQLQPNNRPFPDKPTQLDFLDLRQLLLPQMLDTSAREQERKIAEWVTDEVKAGKKIPYAKLTPEEQHTLLARFVLTAMATAFGSGRATNLITGLDPAGVDENRMRISYANGAITIGILQGGKFTLQEGIMSAKQLPDPLLLHTPF